MSSITSDDELLDGLLFDLRRRPVQAPGDCRQLSHVQRRDAVTGGPRSSCQLGQEIYVADGQLEGVHFGKPFLIR